MSTNIKNDKSNTEGTGEKPKDTMLYIALFLCFILSVSASSGVTYFVFSPAKTIETPLEVKTNEAIQNLENALATQETKIQSIEKQNEVLKLYLRHSSATALKNILIDQETNIQSYLKIMKSAMEDLAEITPRSTDWYRKYQYQLDLASKSSLERENLLKLLKTGEPTSTNK